MKISRGSTGEIVIAVILILSAIYTDSNMIWKVAASSIGIAVLLHSIYLLLKQRKINKSVNKASTEEKTVTEKCKDDTLKYKKILVIILIILLLNTTLVCVHVFSNINNQSQDKNSKKKSKEKEITEVQNIKEPCSFTPSYEVSRVVITADSSAGVGDIFSQMKSDLNNRIYDNKIGDIYYVNYKMNGDTSRYECNESWYNVTLNDGTTGYIWGGYQSMYVKEELK